MAKSLESMDESLGGVEDYLAVWNTRLNTARQELDNAQKKPEAIRSGAVQAAQAEMEKVRAEYEEFLADNPGAKAHLQPGPDTIQ